MQRNQRVTVVRPHYDYKSSQAGESWDVLTGCGWDTVNHPGEAGEDRRALVVFAWQGTGEDRKKAEVARYKPGQWLYVYYTRTMVE